MMWSFSLLRAYSASISRRRVIRSWGDRSGSFSSSCTASEMSGTMKSAGSSGDIVVAPRSVRWTACPFSSRTKYSASSRSRMRCCFIGSLRSASASSSIFCTSCFTPVSFSIFSSRLFFGMPSWAWYSLSAASSRAFASPSSSFSASASSVFTTAVCLRASSATWRLNWPYLSSSSLPTGPEMMSGVRASSMRIESTSSMIAYACSRWTRCSSENTMLSRR